MCRVKKKTGLQKPLSFFGRSPSYSVRDISKTFNIPFSSAPLSPGYIMAVRYLFHLFFIYFSSTFV